MNSNNNTNLYKLRDNIILQLPYRDFNAATNAHFKKNLPRFNRLSQDKVLILDFTNVVLIDNDGMGALMHAWHKCSRSDVKLILCNLNDYNRNFLKNKAFDTLVEITDSLKSAIARGDEYTKQMVTARIQVNKLESFFGNPNSENVVNLPGKVYSLNKVSKRDSKIG